VGVATIGRRRAERSERLARVRTTCWRTYYHVSSWYGSGVDVLWRRDNLYTILFVPPCARSCRRGSLEKATRHMPCAMLFLPLLFLLAAAPRLKKKKKKEGAGGAGGVLEGVPLRTSMRLPVFCSVCSLTWAVALCLVWFPLLGMWLCTVLRL